MSGEQHRPPNGSPDLGRLARELLGEFAEEANAGQMNAIAAAAKRVVRSEKAAPVREFVRGLDDAHGNFFSRALFTILTSKDPESGGK